MAKENSEKTIGATATLPQNVLFIGEHVEENKNIYISQSVYKRIHEFTKNKTTNESGGVLVGEIIEALGKTNIIIKGFIEGKNTEATPTTLKFTHETWDGIHEAMDKKYPEMKMLGWIHTHPNFGIFLSEYDRFIHENFFKEDYEVAYVVDPIQHIEGFYFWIDGKLERCKGFYIYDKVGKKIAVEVESNEIIDHSGFSFSNWKDIAIVVLLITVIAFGISFIGLKNQVKSLSTELHSFKDNVNNNFKIIQDGFNSFNIKFDNLDERTQLLEEYVTQNEEQSETELDEQVEDVEGLVEDTTNNENVRGE